MSYRDETGMDDDTRARVRASDANLAGIIAGRRRAARRLLAPPGPAKAVRDAFKPLSLAAEDARIAGETPGPVTQPEDMP